MKSLQFFAFTSVSIAPHRGRGIALYICAFLVLVAFVWGMFIGNFYLFVLLPLLLYLLNRAKAAFCVRETRRVRVDLCVDSERLDVVMRAARLFNGNYIDQRYICERPLLVALVLDDDGVFRLQARGLESVAEDGGVAVLRRCAPQAELVFTVDRTAVPRVQSILWTCGWLQVSNV